MSMLAPELYRDLIGKPFRAGGRGPEAYDCLGLVLEVTRRRGIDVPDYQSTAEELTRQHQVGVLGPCVAIDKPEPGAIALMRSLGGAERHLGVMIDRYRMLHASEPARAAVCESLSHSLFRRRVLGYYRVEGACSI